MTSIPGCARHRRRDRRCRIGLLPRAGRRAGDPARGGDAGLRGHRPEPRVHLGPHPQEGPGARSRDDDPRAPAGAGRRSSARTSTSRRTAGMVFFSDERQTAVMARVRGPARRRRPADDAASPATRRASSPRPAPRDVVGATFCELDAQVEPTLWVRAFAAAARRLGADIREGVRVERLIRDGDRIVGAETSEGPIMAGEVILAAGGWSPALAATVGLELPDPPDAPPDRPDAADADARRGTSSTARRRSSSTRSSRTCRPTTTRLFMNDVEWRYDMLLLEGFAQKADGSYLLGCAMDYPGFVWDADLRGVSLINELMMAHVPRLREAGFDQGLGWRPAVHGGQPPDHRPFPRRGRLGRSRRATSSATALGRRPDASWRPSSRARSR